MTNIIPLLYKIQNCPGMFIGKKSIIRLRSFIDGYIFALKMAGLEFVADDYYLFCDWLSNKYDVKGAASYETYLPRITGNESDAFDLFYLNLQEYTEISSCS